jgi:hypothetical protein
MKDKEAVEFGDDGASCTVNIRGVRDKTFGFDRVFDTLSSQEELYDSCGVKTVEALLAGYNASVIAYGQTGSGKTYTMMGPGFDGNKEDAKDAPLKNPGLIPRICGELFRRINASRTERVEYITQASYVEIYQEMIKDLLNPSGQAVNESMRIRMDDLRGLYMPDATTMPVKNLSNVLAVLRAGSKARRTESTDMNAFSSRSHAIFILTVHSYDHETKMDTMSSLYLVDLAGSEKVGKTNVSGDRLKEAQKINQSLSALGLVIFALSSAHGKNKKTNESKKKRQGRKSSAAGKRPKSASIKQTKHKEEPSARSLSDSNSDSDDDDDIDKPVGDEGQEKKQDQTTNPEKKKKEKKKRARSKTPKATKKEVDPEKTAFIPYRNSRLTRLLQNCIGGNSKTTLVINCSPSKSNGDETVATLRFGERTQQIRNNSTKNVAMSLAELKALLGESKGKILRQRHIVRKLYSEVKNSTKEDFALGPEAAYDSKGLSEISELHTDRVHVVTPPSSSSSRSSIRSALPSSLPSSSSSSGSTPLASLATPVDGLHTLRRVVVHFICPVSKHVMRDPVVAMDGYTYERKAIQAHFQAGKNLSPVTGVRIGRLLVPNTSMQRMIQRYFPNAPRPSKTRSYFDWLPIVMVNEILDYCHSSSLRTLCTVNTEFRTLAAQDRFWKPHCVKAGVDISVGGSLKDLFRDKSGEVKPKPNVQAYEMKTRAVIGDVLVDLL